MREDEVRCFPSLVAERERGLKRKGFARVFDSERLSNYTD